MLVALGLGTVLFAVGVALAFDNPSIDHTDDGTYQCFAPYDTILFGARNNVGMHSDPMDIEDRCYSVSRDRFLLASACAGLGAVVYLITFVGAASVVRQRRAT